MNDLVSIIMPSYNTASFIHESIESVQNQTFKNWELIIIDDCSTDSTDSVVSQYLFDSRIKYFKNERNIGAALSRNRALRLAKGKWIAFLDSDDLWKSSKLEKQIKFMKKNGYFFSYTNYSEINMLGYDIGRIVTGPQTISYSDFLKYCWIGCLTVMYDSEKVGLIQIQNLKKNNDYAMWLMISKKVDCYLLDENLGKYRRGRSGSISTVSFKNLLYWHFNLFYIGEGKTIIFSVFYTILNLIYGIFKKVFFVKRC